MKFGSSHNALDTMYPAQSRIQDLSVMTRRSVPKNASMYGYVIAGSMRLELADGTGTVVPKGMVFAFDDTVKYLGQESGTKIWTAIRHGFRVPFTITKPEHKGRLSYIDGCSDTLLVYPPRLGDGSLSLLYFPAGIDQSWHTHPSIRLGFVASGEGVAHWTSPTNRKMETKLKAGMSFMLPSHGLHRFCTKSDAEMRILAYHPDGDWGPTDQAHTMLNRTYLK